MKVSPFFKWFNIVWVILFIIFAGLQYNDPDPYIWMPIYLYGSWICFEAAKGKYHPKAYLIGIIVYSVYAIYKVFDAYGVIDWLTKYHAESLVESMKAEKPWIEETREFGGLMILIIVIGIDWIYLKRQHKAITN